MSSMETLDEVESPKVGIVGRSSAMTANSKKSIGGAIALLLFGLLALLGGAKWLGVLIPLALAVWYAVTPTVQSGGRN